MKKHGEALSALAILAAVAGTGYASGREIVVFFAQTGRMSWIGVCFAPVVFGLLVALLCHCAWRVDAGDFVQFCHRMLGRRAGAVAGWLYGLLLALTAVVMLCGAGETGALALPVRQGWLWGAGIALLIALFLNLSRLRPMPWLGAIVLVVGVALYGALALDSRPTRVWLDGAVQLALEDSWPAAILLALAHGAMNASLAASVALRFSSGMRPWRLGLCCGLSMFALLAVANGAIIRGGDQLLCQAMPTVVLAARWGLVGFWACVAFTYLCATTTLAAALGGLMDLLRGGGGRIALLTLLAAAALAILRGLQRAVGAVYPAVGWVCAALMLALACRADEMLFRSAKRLNFMGQNPHSRLQKVPLR